MAPPKGFKHSEEAKRKMSQAQTIPVEERYWGNVDKDGPLCDRLGSKCWVWVGYTSKGYGYLSVNGLLTPAHRVSYEMHIGRPIPADGHILHECDNPACVNPAHLSLGDHVRNMKDAGDRNRLPSGERHWACKLSNEQVQEILELLPKQSRRSIARLYGVSSVVIDRIAWGRRKGVRP